MVELKILSGKQAGSAVIARRFPFLVGRSAQAGLQLEDEGIFDQHFEIRLESTNGFVLAVRPEAYVAINGQTAQQQALKSGDLISAGSVKLGFSLSPAPSRSLRFKEGLVWVGLALLCLAQVAIIYLLSE